MSYKNLLRKGISQYYTVGLKRYLNMCDKISFYTFSPDDKPQENIEIFYDLIKNPFGYSVVAVQDDKICNITFQDDDDAPRLETIQSDWPGATLTRDPEKVKKLARLVFEGGEGNIDVLLRGTDLQVSVWKELTRIKSGTMVSYGKVAELIDKPKAIRPVARAVATNRIAYLIPCHRVIKKNGDLHNYGGGRERKEQILKYEGAI